MTNHFAEAERVLGKAHHFTYGDGADATIGQALATEGTGYALLAIADRLDAWLTAKAPASPTAPTATERDTTAEIVSGAVRNYIERREAGYPGRPVDLRGEITQMQLVNVITTALVGGEGEQDAATKFPDVATSTSHGHRDREAVIRDALYEATGDAENAAWLARVADDALIATGFSTSPLAARLAAMVAPCQLVMDVLVQYGVHDDGPYGDQGRMMIAIAVAGALIGTDVDDTSVRVDRTHAAVAAAYGGQCDLQDVAEDIVRALAEGRTS